MTITRTRGVAFLIQLFPKRKCTLSIYNLAEFRYEKEKKEERREVVHVSFFEREWVGKEKKRKREKEKREKEEKRKRGKREKERKRAKEGKRAKRKREKKGKKEKERGQKEKN